MNKNMDKNEYKYSRWLTVAELAEWLKISERTIRRRIADGTVKAEKLFGKMRIPTEQFEK